MYYQRIEHIAAGQLKAGKAQPVIYQAYLGTCLGVALYDRKRKIGGMIHILLPEPPGTTIPGYEKKYASKGVPLLINKLLDMGAQQDDLEASIAGGALVGPVSPQDMNLDIGGRSLEIAATILKSNGIRIVQSETGGFFTCTLELNMETGDAVIKPAWEDTFEQERKFPKPTMPDILNTIDNLKPIPQTALKIIRMFNSDQNNILDITDELAKDQVLTGQTLKLCNSALFSGRIKIETLKDAVLLLGEEMLMKSVITASINNYYHQTGTSGYSLCKGGLFFHSVGVAAIAEKLAARCKNVNTKLAYTLGLLHDIGKVVLDQYVAESSPLLFRKLSRENISMVDAEKKILGITHNEAGALLAKQWNLSDNMMEIILHHHTPEKSKNGGILTYIVYLADLIMEKFSTGFDLERMQTKSLEKAFRIAGLTMKDLLKLIDEIPLTTIRDIDISPKQRQAK